MSISNTSFLRGSLTARNQHNEVRSSCNVRGELFISCSASCERPCSYSYATDISTAESDVTYIKVIKEIIWPVDIESRAGHRNGCWKIDTIYRLQLCQAMSVGCHRFNH